MDTLYTVLLQMKTSLDELEAVVTEEVNQLNRAQINPVSLQILTDSKSQLLATLQHYDRLRLQEEARQHLQAPYHRQSKLFACWQQVSQSVAECRRLNEKMAELLNQHRAKNQQLKKLVDAATGGSPLYGADGEARSASTGSSYNISV